MIFAEVRVGDDFTWKGELYQKVDFESAIPISFVGEQREFTWNEQILGDKKFRMKVSREVEGDNLGIGCTLNAFTLDAFRNEQILEDKKYRFTLIIEEL